MTRNLFELILNFTFSNFNIELTKGGDRFED